MGLGVFVRRLEDAAVCGVRLWVGKGGKVLLLRDAAEVAVYMNGCGLLYTFSCARVFTSE